MFEKDEAKITDKMGLILKGIRLQKGFSRQIIAERAKISVRHLAAIENKQRAPSIEVFCRIVRALGISADRVVYPEDEVEESEEAQLVWLIRVCDVRDRAAIKAMVGALLYSREETSQAGEANACAV